MQAIFGMFMADLTQHPPAQSFLARHRWFSMVVAPTTIILGLYLASYPGAREEYAAWSSSLATLSHHIFPRDADVPRYFSAVGCDLILVGIYLSSRAKDALSHRWFLWLGKHSFAVYLLHGTLLRTILTWMLYGMIHPPSTGIASTSTSPNSNATLGAAADLPSHDGEYFVRQSRLIVAISVPLWLGLVYLCAHLWTSHVDPFCAMITRSIERRTIDD